MKKAFLLFILLFLIIFGAYYRAQQINYHSTFESVCYLAYTKVYKEKELLSPWFYHCMEQAQNTDKYSSKGQLVSKMQMALDRMGVNHLYIMSPESESYRKTGKAKSTGLISYIDGDRLRVRKVIKGSSADKGGVMAGDYISGVKGKEIFHPSQTFSLPGEYTFVRVVGNKEMKIVLNIKLTPVQENLKVQIYQIEEDKTRLVIPSFYTEVFSKQYVKSIIDELNRFNNVEIDLSNNMGGHIISGLRLLSGLMCGEKPIGSFHKPRLTTEVSTTLEDKDDYSEDYHMFFQFSKIKLSTFNDYGCFKGKITLKINEETASISEIFALALKEKLNAKVYGENSSGQGVMALRYELNELGKGFSIIIPEALYKSEKGRLIEGAGVL